MLSEYDECQECTPSIGKWNIETVIARGSDTRIFHAKDPDTAKQVAVKVFFPRHISDSYIIQKRAIAQAKLLNRITHVNIVRIEQFYDSTSLFDSNGTSNRVAALVMEHVDVGGDLCDLIQSTGPLPDRLSRTYFHQIVGAIEHMHSQKVVHGNIRPENILVDKDFHLKIIDFGCIMSSIVRKPFKIFIEETNYHPPEVYFGFVRKRVDLDVFAMGMMLFIICVGHMPFSAAHPEDPLYRLIMQGKFRRFWSIHENLLDQAECQTELNHDLKKLLQRIFDPDPTTRPSLRRIKDSAWFNGPTVEMEQLQKMLRQVV